MSFHARTCAIAGAFVLANLAGVALAAALLLPIAPLLPHEGDAVCFAATFDSAQELRFGWGSKVDDGPAPVTAMRVRISPPPPLEPPEPDSPFYGQPVHGYGFVYQAQIVAEISGKGRYSAPTQCGSSDAPPSRFDAGIYCGIDCDGGMVWLSRVPGRGALEVKWDAGRHLRMSACGGGGAYLRAEGGPRTFRLEPVLASECKSTAERD